jgi:hypothetical protein
VALRILARLTVASTVRSQEAHSTKVIIAIGYIEIQLSGMRAQAQAGRGSRKDQQTAGKARGRDDEKEGVGGSKAFGDAAVPMAAKVLVRKALSAIGLREAVLKAAVAKTKKERKKSARTSWEAGAHPILVSPEGAMEPPTSPATKSALGKSATEVLAVGFGVLRTTKPIPGFRLIA